MFAKSYGHAGCIALAVSLVFPPAFAQSEFQSNRYDLLAALDPVVVTASRFEEPQGQATVLIDVIQKEEIQDSGAISITELLDRIPGVNIIRQYGRLGIDASIDVGYLGGSSAQRTLVLVDGVRLNDVDDGTVGLGSITLSAIERIEIRRAGGGVLFGDRALGGVINIITKPERADKTNVSVSAGSFGFNSIGASISRLAGEGSVHLDVQKAQIDGYRRNTSQKQTSVFGRVLIPTALGDLGVTARMSDEDLRLPYAITLSKFNSDPKDPGLFITKSLREGFSGTVSLDTQIDPSLKTALKLVSEKLKINSFTNYKTDRKTLHFDVSKKYDSTLVLFGAEAFDAISASNRTNRSKVEQISNAFYLSAEQSIQGAKLMAGARTQAMKNKYSPTMVSTAQTSSERLSSWSLAFKQPLWGGDLRGGLQSSFAFPNTDQLFTFDSKFPFSPKDIYPGVKAMKSSEAQIGWTALIGRNFLDLSIRNILIKDEIGFKSGCVGSDSCNDNLYDTERIVLSARYTRSLAINTKFDIAFDLVKARIESGQNTGNRVPMTPTRSVKASLSQTIFGGQGFLVANYRNAMYALDDNFNSGLKIPPRTLVDLGWNRTFNSNLEVQIWVRNLLDKQYFDFASYLDSFSISNGYDGVAPGDGRSAEFTLRYRF
jgi:iron complex outermembrane recepter protein